MTSDQSLASKTDALSGTPRITDPLITDYSPRTLRSDLETGRLPAARVLELGLALTEALAHLHGHGLVHRDLKPSNLIFVDGRPKLTDIGLVTDASDARSFVGTEGYLPPEGPGTPAADIFALGKVLYEALTGLDRRQFPELPADLRQWTDAALAFELNTILVRACAADARERYASAEALLADLRLLDAGKSVKRRRSVQRGWARTWKMAAVLALVALGALLIRNERARRPAVSVGDLRSFENSGTTNYAAWEALQRGGLMGEAYNALGLSNAIREKESAVALDPKYVSGWINLSSSLFLSVFYGYIPGDPAIERARFGAQKAIELKPTDPGGWHMLADCNLALDYDFAGAELLFRKAIQLDPKFDVLRQNFGDSSGITAALLRPKRC